MSNCGDKFTNLGRLCISSNDLILIILNLIAIFSILSIIFVKNFLDKSHRLNVSVKNNFSLLGEGSLGSFYSTTSIQQKQTGPKKKIGSKINSQLNQTEKIANNNELKCNQCGRTVEVSYQYTLHKLSVQN